MPAALDWTIFCRVVDNYGDAGVCWRLARQLVAEYGQRVTLWIDAPQRLARLWPAVDATAAAQTVAGVRLRRWDAAAAEAALGDVVIEAFACELPPAVRAALRLRRPLWINLEYLSAEPWVAGCHGLPSPQPGGPDKVFFFPGFTAGTGGLLAEAAALRARAAWGAAQAQDWLAAQGIAGVPGARRVSLFAYANAALPEWLDALAAGPGRWHLLVPQGRVLAPLAAWCGAPLAPGTAFARGALQVSVLPFLDQDGYDRLLWSCDLNLVRGEDSFVRAQWARRPLLWQAYRQEADAHLVKLDAWLARYLAGVPAAPAAACAALHRAWNRERGVAAAWPGFVAALPALAAHAARWADALSAYTDLAGNLVAFAAARRVP